MPSKWEQIISLCILLSRILSQTEMKFWPVLQKISDSVDIGIALWSHPDSGYLMSPALCNELAELPNVIAIKYSVEQVMYAELTRLAGDKLLVSTSSEVEWLDNIIDLGWQLYLCSSPPYFLHTVSDRRMNDYTQAAFAGEIEKTKAIGKAWNLCAMPCNQPVPAENLKHIRNTDRNCWVRWTGQYVLLC